jgi:GntR family transcriptional repressor for pyruvate dehydrogenase complex
MAPEEYLLHDRSFHQTVGAASGNRILTALMNMVAAVLLDARHKMVSRAHDLKESAEMHRKIYRAIRDRNPDSARDAMRDHLLLAQKAQEVEVDCPAVAPPKISARAQTRKPLNQSAVIRSLQRGNPGTKFQPRSKHVR